MPDLIFSHELTTISHRHIVYTPIHNYIYLQSYHIFGYFWTSQVHLIVLLLQTRVVFLTHNVNVA